MDKLVVNSLSIPLLIYCHKCHTIAFEKFRADGLEFGEIVRIQRLGRSIVGHVEIRMTWNAAIASSIPDALTFVICFGRVLLRCCPNVVIRSVAMMEYLMPISNN